MSFLSVFRSLEGSKMSFARVNVEETYLLFPWISPFMIDFPL